MPGRNGGTLRRGGPGRPKAREDVVDALRAVLFADGDNAIIPALVAKAIKGDIRAIELCLAYGIGKPTDRVELSGPEGGPIEHVSALSDDELRLVRATLREIEAEESAPGDDPGGEGATQGA